MGFVLSLPNFGGEHVHIKVHLSPKHVTTTDVLASQQNDVNHKIFHHYYHYKTAAHKEIVPVLESIYLSELDKFHIHDRLHQHKQKPKYFEEIFLVKAHSNSPKPKDDHFEYAKNSAEAIRLIERNHNHDIEYKLRHQENIDHHIASVKVVEDNSFERYHKGKRLENIIRAIEAPKFTTPTDDHHHAPQVQEVVDEASQVEGSLSEKAKNHNFDNQYGYVSPEKTQSFHFQEVPIYQQIPHTQQSSPRSTLITKDCFKYSRPLEASPDYLQQNTQSIKLTSVTTIGEEQGAVKYVTDYEKYFPSSENPPSFRDPQQNFSKLKQASVDIDSNTKNIYDGNPKAVETYTGYDSYSVAHVQGLGSGGYTYHKPF